MSDIKAIREYGAEPAEPLAQMQREIEYLAGEIEKTEARLPSEDELAYLRERREQASRSRRDLEGSQRLLEWGS